MATMPPASAAPQKPGKVQAIAIMTLIGGILMIVLGAVWILSACGTFGITLPSGIYSLIAGIFATIKGSKLMGQDAQMESPPKTTAILQIVNAISCDTINVVMGIVILVFLNDPEVKAWYRG